MDLDADAIMFDFGKESVLACDFGGFLDHFAESKLPSGPDLKRMQGKLHISVQGFDDDPRELYEIPEVRQFCARFLAVFPHWFFFMSLESDNLKVMVSAVLESLQALRRDQSPQVQVSYDPQEMLRFIKRQFFPMNLMCERAGMTEAEITGLTDRVLRYFGLPTIADPGEATIQDADATPPITGLANWNPLDKAKSFRRFAQELKEESKRVFRHDTHHVELFFLVDDSGQAEVAMVPPKTERDEMVDALKQRIRGGTIYGAVHIFEGWMYLRRKPGDHTMAQIIDGEIKVSELRPEDRDEALVVTMESRDGAHFMWLTPILRDGDRVSLGETITFPEPPGGRLAGLFGTD